MRPHTAGIIHSHTSFSDPALRNKPGRIQMTEMKYPVQLKLRIDWSELDLFGHVNNVSFFKYIQAARVHYWEKCGLTALHKKSNIGPLLAFCSCDFRQPLFYPGHITLYSRMEFIKNTSFGIVHKLVNQKDITVAEAKDVMVLFDYTLHQKTSFPKTLKAKIEKLEGRTF
ncbi:MAG: acyl-CoA thioesterase [Bacteroidia bacterium]|nr:acyl-CoA thioesterase [Bacteroidia bacterium]